MKKWHHQYHTDIIKSSSPRDKAIAILEGLNFDYFRDVPMVPSTYLRLVCKMFSAYYPARYDQADASDLVPNRKVIRMPSSSSSSSSSSQPAKKSKIVTVDEEEEDTPIADLIVGHLHHEMDKRFTEVASTLTGDVDNYE